MFQPGTHRVEIRSGDRDRNAIIYVPSGADSTSPMMFALHGAGTNAEEMIDFCGMNQLADVEGFTIVYPNGTGRTDGAGTWNGGPDCGYAGRQQIDDVGFIDELITYLQSKGHHGRHRFAIGMSNGGLMCYRLAEALSHLSLIHI